MPALTTATVPEITDRISTALQAADQAVLLLTRANDAMVGAADVVAEENQVEVLAIQALLEDARDAAQVAITAVHAAVEVV